jgi:hypothetical protein
MNVRARAHDLVRDLALDLERVRDLALNLERVRDLAHDLERARTRVLDIERICDLALDLERVRDLALNLERVRDLALDLDLEHDLDIDRVRVLGLHLAHIRSSARVLEHDLDLARDLDLEHDLEHAHATTVDLATALAFARAEAVDPGGAGVPVRVSGQARRLAHAAARLLPAAERSRYAEEYAGELWGIAEAGGRRRSQVSHALSMIRGALMLRFELGRPQRRKAP